MLYKRRCEFRNLSLRIGKFFSKFGLSPNQLTGISVLFALAGFYFLTKKAFLFAFLSLVIAAILDFIDGAVARATGKQTKLGAYLDTIADRYVEFIIILGVLFASLPKFIISAAGWITIFLFGSLVTTYAKAAAFEKLGLKINGGVLERAERLALLLIGILLAAINPAYLTSILAVLAFLTNISAIQRVLSAVKKLKQKKKVLKI